MVIWHMATQTWSTNTCQETTPTVIKEDVCLTYAPTEKFVHHWSANKEVPGQPSLDLFPKRRLTQTTKELRKSCSGSTIAKWTRIVCHNETYRQKKLNKQVVHACSPLLLERICGSKTKRRISKWDFNMT